MQIAYKTDIGQVRQNNEDSVGYFENQAGIKLAIVADGVGGHQAGEVASGMAVTHLGYQFEQTTFTTSQEGEAWLKTVVMVENQTILAKAHSYQDLSGMGTTLVCALIFPKSFIMANIGDSRGYLLRQGKLSQLTEDHSFVNELLKRGEISPSEAQHHPQKNLITRSLGISKQTEIDEKTFPSQNDDLLLICSDGLTNMVSDDELQAVLLQDNSLTEKCQTLITLANQAGGRDNITVFLLALDREVE